MASTSGAAAAESGGGAGDNGTPVLSTHQSPRNTSSAAASAGAGAVSVSGSSSNTNSPYVMMGLIEVPKALQDGEKFIKWDEVSFLCHTGERPLPLLLIGTKATCVLLDRNKCLSMMSCVFTAQGFFSVCLVFSPIPFPRYETHHITPDGMRMRCLCRFCCCCCCTGGKDSCDVVYVFDVKFPYLHFIMRCTCSASAIIPRSVSVPLLTAAPFKEDDKARGGIVSLCRILEYYVPYPYHPYSTVLFLMEESRNF